MTQTARQIEQRLEVGYRRIEAERMADMPILNSALSIKAIGFQPYQDDWVGVMVTPWFMNLMIVPGQQLDVGRWSQEIGAKSIYGFEAGQFEFIYGEDDLVGKSLICSLFSPMFEFGDQATAEQTALSVLELLKLPKQADELDQEVQQQQKMGRYWQDAPAPASAAELEPKPEKPELSRRAFLSMGSSERANLS